MIILLLLLPTLVLSTESLLDWSNCETYYDCYCMDKNYNRLNPPGYNTETSDCAEIGVKIQYFPSGAAIIQMQIAGDAAHKLGEEPLTMITRAEFNVTSRTYEERSDVVGCKFNKKGKNVEMVGDSKIIEKYEISLLEDRSRIESEIVLCSIKMQRHFDYIWSANISGIFILRTNAVEYKGRPYGDVLRDRNNRERQFICDPFSIKEISYSNDYHVKPVTNRDTEVINCDGHESDGFSYTMRYDYLKKGIKIKELKCKGTFDTGYFYHILTGEYETVHNDDYSLSIPSNVSKLYVEQIVQNPESYAFYCSLDIAESCEDPRGDCTFSFGCPSFNADKMKGRPATLECPDNKWLIDGEYYQLEADPVCKRKKYSKANEAKFYAKLPSGNEVTLSGARCFKDYDCAVHSKLDLPLCDDESQCGGVDRSDKNVLKCKNPARQLRIYSPEDGATLTESSYKCNTTSGIWYNGAVIVPRESVVRCDDKATIETESEIAKNRVVRDTLPQLLNAIKTLLDTLTGVSGDSPNQSRLMYGTTEETRESNLAGAKQP